MTTPNTVYLTYNGFVSQLATLTVVQTVTTGGVVAGVDPDFNAVLPQAINYAELRIQRDLDFLQSLTDNNTYAMTAGNNHLSIDVNAFITIQTIRYVNGTQEIPLLPTSSNYIQTVYPDSSVTGPPQFYAPYGGDAATTGATSQVWLFGPYADQNYPLHIRGTVRMISLASFNTSPAASTSYTFISAYLPDLMLMAAMIYISGFQRNFGRQSDDPQMSVSYESQYQGLLKSAMVEEARRKFQAGGWTSMAPPTPAATPTR